MTASGLQTRVLLVEDNALDAKATLRAAQTLDVANQIVHVTDGQTALDYLRSTIGEANLTLLVLLDLNLPGKDGHDVLREIRADAALRTIPVVVLTSSEDKSDITQSYALGANAYISKPVGLDGWIDVIGRIESFWLSLAKMPSN